jgi:hypothetical protein
MKFSLATLSLAGLATTVLSKDTTWGDYKLDTKRAPTFFETPKARKGGYDYADFFSMGVSGSMDAEGMTLSGSMTANGDTSMVVTDMPGGGEKVDVVVNNLKVDVKSFMANLQCDSNDRAKSSPDCELSGMYDVIGTTESLVIDEEGNIASVTLPDGETLDTVDLEAEMAMQKQFLDQLSASQHFDKHAQILKLIPDHAVKPGDSWIDNVDMAGFGTFTGNSYFKGYISDFKGSDCAVFYFEGNLHLDVSQIATMMVGPDVSVLDKQEMNMDLEALPKMVDAKITNVIYFDHKDNLPRFAQSNFSTTFDVPNPMDPTDPNIMHVPIEATFSLSTDITSRPEGSVMEATAYSTTSNSNSSSGGGSGKFIMSVVFLFGLAAVTGLVVQKRRQEAQNTGNQFQPSIPDYEFTTVANENEPMYSPPPRPIV